MRPWSRPIPERAGQGQRLQKILAAAGLASRRAGEELIRAGRVRVNGRIVRELGTRADPLRDHVSVDGESVGRPRRCRYYLVYKPRGVITTTRDPHAKRTVLDLVRSRVRLFPVGRLDAASEGLVLLTNDGALAQVMLHPSFRLPRTYRVSVDGEVLARDLKRLASGIEIRGRRQRVADARLLERSAERSVLQLTLLEGRRRQIREMLGALGHRVRRLVRLTFGPLSLRGLRPGESRPLRADEISALRRLVARSHGPAAGPVQLSRQGIRRKAE